jgi:hypothetical protein
VIKAAVGEADRARVARRRRGNSDDDTARAILGLIVLGVMTGVVQRFLARWWPVLAAGGVLLVVLLVWLSVHRHRRRVRERRLRQELDRQIRTADQLSPREFEELIARLLVQAGWADVKVSGGARGPGRGRHRTLRRRPGAGRAVQAVRPAPAGQLPGDAAVPGHPVERAPRRPRLVRHHGQLDGGRAAMERPVALAGVMAC